MIAWRIALMLVAATLAWEGGVNAQAQEMDAQKPQPTTLDPVTIDTALEHLNYAKAHGELPDEPSARGPFLGVEMDWVRPTLLCRRGNSSDHVTNELGWTLSPRLSFCGEDWDETRGEIAYQFLIATSPERLFASTPISTLPIISRSHVETHVLDF